VVVGEPTIGLGIHRHKPPCRNPLKEPGDLRPDHPVPRVHDGREGLCRPDEPGHLPDVGVQHPGLAARPAGPGDRLLPDPCLQEWEIPVTGEGDGVLAGEFEPVHLPREVGGRHHHPAVEPPVADGVVEERGARHPDIGDLRPTCNCAFRKRPGKRRGREPHILPDDDPLRRKEPDEGVSDPLRRRLIEFVRVAPPDVVGLEDAGHQVPSRSGDIARSRLITPGRTLRT
jgi:hypothetical protein